MRDVEILIKEYLGVNNDVQTIDKTLKALEDEIFDLEDSINKKSCYDLYSKYGKLSARFESLSIARSYISSLENIERMKHLDDFNEDELEKDSLELKENLAIKLKEYSLLNREE